MRLSAALLLSTVFLFVVTAASGAESTNAAGARSAAGDDWVARNWQTQDGLPQNTVNALAHTKDGYLWIGTSGGLARFDGVRFRTLGLEDGLRSVQIVSLHEDLRGTLWVGTVGGGFSRWEDGRFASWGAAEGFPARTAQVIAGDNEGTLWIGTEKGLVRWRDGTFQVMGKEQGIPAKPVRTLALDSRGVLWVVLSLEGLFCGTNGLFAPAPATPSKPGGVYSLQEDRNGSIWAGEGGGNLWRWRGGTWERYGPTNGLPKNLLTNLAQDGTGTFWVGARDSGIYFLGDGGFQKLPVASGLPEGSISALFADREGTLWVGVVGGGLNRLSRRILRQWGKAEGLTEPHVTSVSEDATGGVWVSTQDDGLWRFQDRRFSKVRDPKVSNHSHAYSTAATADGSVWVAGEQFLDRFQPGQDTRAYKEPPVRGEAIRALCADGTNLWLGTYYSTLLYFDGHEVRVVATNGSFGGDITSLVREGPDTLWIGTSDGLHRWERGRVRTWTTRDGLLTANVRALHRDSDGTMWVGTLGGGLARLKDGRLVNITTHHGLIDDVISQIVADDLGNLWLGCNRGLMRVARADLDAFIEAGAESVHPIILGRNEGLISDQFPGGHGPTAIKARDGRLLFSTLGGIVEVDPRQFGDLIPANTQPVIEELLVDGKARDFSEPLVVSPGNHRIQFSYTAPSLRSGEWIRFRTRLEGLDENWVPGGSRRTVTYSGLRPGRYVFQVGASDSQRMWNASAASLPIVVQPFFWQTYGFASMVIILWGCALFAWYRGRITLMESRRVAQELFTRQLIAAQEVERARLARELHDDITQRLARLAIDAGRIEQGGSGQDVDKTMRGVREGLVVLSEDVHTLSYRLHSSVLEDLGLVEALKAECERFARQESIACEVKLQGKVPAVLPHDTALGLFRITQEALRNVARHAHAGAVEVTLRYLDDGLQLGVHDNGSGFNPLQKRERVSLGLTGMRERMELIGGELDIESSPGHGTTVVAWVMVKQKET